MEFTLNEYHRDISNEELLGDLLRVANLLKSNKLSRSEYKQHGKFGTSTISRRFGGWNNAISKIGLSVSEIGQQKHEYLEKAEDFFLDIKRIADELGKEYITTGEYEQYGKYNRSSMFRRYGSWDEILKMAGLKQTPYRIGNNKSISDEELFQDIERVWLKLGRQPTITDVKNGEFSFSQNTFTRRFGGWRKALEAFVNYINTDDSEIINDTTDEDTNIESPHEINTNDTEILPNTIDEERIIYSSNENKPSYYRHKTKREPSNKLKVQVLMRDGNRCRICGVACNDGIHKINFDHIIPWAKGGETALENLQVLCSDCNAALGDLDK